ncbi:MAG: hypothetical protein ACE15C_13115 [Phycisphaerae bacterium]
MPPPSKAWYEEVADGTLEQGDILADCPAGFLPLNWDPLSVEQDIQVDSFDLVVLTQSCDLAYDKVKYVVCCPIYAHLVMDGRPPLNNMNSEGRRKFKDMVIDGLMPGYCMIEEHVGELQRPISIVDFHEVFSMPKQFLQSVAENRHLRLVSPYREHISQSFARFFMRVGLPSNVRKFR